MKENATSSSHCLASFNLLSQKTKLKIGNEEKEKSSLAFTWDSLSLQDTYLQQIHLKKKKKSLPGAREKSNPNVLLLTRIP